MALKNRLTDGAAHTGSGWRVASHDPQAPYLVAQGLRALLGPRLQGPLVFLCIGTDRSTGDALGPLVGQRLLHLISDRIHVFGTLDEPVHAGNLADAINRIRDLGQACTVVAIDACLGRADNVGSIGLSLGPLLPGAGVNKQLPAVGDCHITGTVNVGGFMEYLVLQNTRLSVVIRIADAIAAGIALALQEVDDATVEGDSLAPVAATGPRAPDDPVATGITAGWK